MTATPMAHASRAGLVFLSLFALSQGVRDAYFGHVFQAVSFLLVAVLAFGASTLVFGLLALVRRPGDLALLLGRPRDLLMLNLTTAAAWLCFFYGLQHLEPAVVATLYNGVGPLVIVALGSAGLAVGQAPAGRMEWGCYGAIALALTGLVAVVLADRSGLPGDQGSGQMLALAAVVLGGAMITISYLFARRLTDGGLGSDSVMAARFLLTLALALLLEGVLDPISTRPPAEALALLGLAAFALIVVPSFLVQLGVSRSSPLAANVFRALGPVCVFAVQQLDGRLRFSGATLVCIVLFCSFTIAASLLRAWHEAGRRIWP